MFQGRGLADDSRWRKLLQTWALFEAQEGYQALTKLSPLNRPPEIAAWIQRARSTRYQPPIDDIDEYARSFRTWWASLQPELRRLGDSVLHDSVDGDWTCLKKGGVNGVLSVLAGLFFWGAVIKNRPDRPGKKDKDALRKDTAAWEDAVNDCRVALSSMVGPC